MTAARGLALVAILALPLAAWGRAASPADARQRSRALDAEVSGLTRSAEVNHALVELGQLAERRSQEPRVRQLGARVASQAQQANTELRQLMTRRGLSFPDGMGADDESRVADVKEQHGAALDRGFLDESDSLLREELGVAHQLARQAPDPDVRRWAAGAQR